MLRLEGHWVWDSWVVDDGVDFHLFFLKAERSAAGPSSRHTRAVVGHAVSRGLVSWSECPDALGPSDAGWDDLAIWTGSVVRDDAGRWRLFYTAISRRGRLGDQRLGLAVSDDLMSWRRVGDAPLLDIDPRWYKTHPDDVAASETWRDPQVFRDPDGDGWHMLVTARAVGAERNDDGVVGHARSPDLATWEVRAPLSAPGSGFGQLEVLQVHRVDGQWVLVFTCHPDEQTAEHRARFGDFCTWSVAGDSPLGPWDVHAARPFTAVPDLFAAPLVRRRDGTWCLVGFRNREAEGVDALEIVDPVPVRLEDGRLVADE